MPADLLPQEMTVLQTEGKYCQSETGICMKKKKRALEKEEVEKTRPDYNLFRRTHFKSSGQLGVAKRI